MEESEIMAKKQFKAESKRLLDLMINSIYTHKEIFLRELISNASDAEDKLAYKALTDDQVPVDRSQLKITIVPDKEKRTLTISDNGVGMTKEELENNLGTIAHSGSLQFKQEMDQEHKGEDIDVIGQFGVGFYSAFMVADAVTVISKAYGSGEAYMWQSDGADGYTITPCEKDAPGSDIIMHIKPNADEENYDQYLETYKLQELIKKYSDYIRYPIVMEVEDYRQKPKPEDAGDDYKPEWETVKEWKTINSMVPLWQRPKAKVTDEEYNSFYKEKFMDWQDPLAVIHTSAEGAVTYKALLYIPQKAPYDFYTREYQKGLQLYSSGVMIMDKCADLLPDYFRFVKGVVDSPARPAAEGDCQRPGEEDQGRAGEDAEGRPGEVRKVLGRLRQPDQVRRGGRLWSPQGQAERSAPVLVLQGGQEHHPGRLQGPYERGPALLLLRLRRECGQDRQAAPGGAHSGQGL